MPKEHSVEEIEDFARRMAWEGIPEMARETFRQMARQALPVHEQLAERTRQRARFEAIVNPPKEGT